jgi:UDP-glucose 4-epimerase
MSHCCLIGGGGFIGSYLAEVLIKKGKKVTVIGRSLKPKFNLPESVTYISGNVREKFFLNGILSKVDEVVDLAYATTPQASFENPTKELLCNLPTAVNFFQVVSSLELKKIIVVSSGGTVYGRSTSVPIKEESPTNPISPYGITKLAIEKYALMYHHLFDVPIVCVRPSNAFGERQEAFAGQGFIATALFSILQQKEIKIFGAEGTVRDYIHAKDVAGAISATLDSGKIGKCYNIGSGVGKSNIEVLDAIQPLAELSGFQIRVKHLPKRLFDVESNVLDCSKLKKDSGWEPSVSFEEAIANLWESSSSHYCSRLAIT